MRKLRLGQIVEAIAFDLKRMEETGVSACDISRYLQRKSEEVGSSNIR